jgi:DNA-binding CsgD family transcriptional regulator
MMERLFFELVEELDNVVSRNTGDAALQFIASKYALTNVAYLGINIPRIKDPAYIMATYSTAWVHRYVSKDYVSLDPVIQVGLRGILPVDWKDVRNQNKAVRDFFGESVEFGLGQQGLSIPIRGVHGEAAMFSINADRTDRAWASDKRRLMRDFQVLAFHFHNRVLERLGVSRPEVQLSANELECLKWAAAGKTTFDTSIILNISHRNVRFFLESARSKLDACTTAQAVARALRLGLI